ncbi:MAG: hypothetical protein QM754_12340 [Tepidisphaeraceae bacterium]
MEIVFGFLVVIAVIAVAAVLFCVWLIATVVRGIGNAVRPRRQVVMPAGRQVCNNRDCLGDNPDHARFCRRCGRPLPALMRLVETQAA